MVCHRCEEQADKVFLKIAYRWLLGYGLIDETPHFSTISYNFRHRFNANTIDKIFAWILGEADRVGYLKPEAVFVDETHIILYEVIIIQSNKCN